MRIYTRHIVRYHRATKLRSEFTQLYTQPLYLRLSFLTLNKLLSLTYPIFRVIEVPHLYLYAHIPQLRAGFYIPLCCQAEILSDRLYRAKNQILSESGQ